MSKELEPIINNYRNLEEVLMHDYLEELCLKDLVKNFEYEPEKLIIQETVYLQPTKEKLINRISYTYDFRIEWNIEHLELLLKKFLILACLDENNTITLPNNKEYLDEFNKSKELIKLPFIAFYKDEKLYSYIDVKGGYAAQDNTSALTFPLKRAMLLNKHSIYVSKIIIDDIEKDSLFMQTFAPASYFLTEKKKQLKIKRVNGKLMPITDILKSLSAYLSTDIVKQNK